MEPIDAATVEASPGEHGARVAPVPAAGSYRIEVAPDALLRRSSKRAVTAKTAWHHPVTGPAFYWRVAARSKTSAKGKLGAARRIGDRGARRWSIDW